MSEAHVLQSIRLALSNGVTRLFRNNVGTAWQGEATQLPNGDVLIRRAQRVKYGLQVGSGDLIGWRSVLITPEMVGQRAALFLSIEVKSATGAPTPEQERWALAVNLAGGRAGIVRSVEEAEAIITGRPAGA